jgi:hypothetical protein
MAKKKVTKKKMAECDIEVKTCKSSKCGSGSCAYFLGFIGASVYYIQTTVGFWNGVWGVIKALVWPAILVYKLFNFLAI